MKPNFRLFVLSTLFAAAIAPSAVFASLSQKEVTKGQSSENSVELSNYHTADQAVSDIEIVFTSELEAVQDRKPEALMKGVKAMTPFIDKGADGLITLNAPADVIKKVDQEVYSAFKGSIEQTNQSLQSGTAQTRRRIPIGLLTRIYNRVKQQGRWVWYRVNQCSAAVLLAWPRIQASSPDPTDWVIRGAEVCARAMRK